MVIICGYGLFGLLTEGTDHLLLLVSLLDFSKHFLPFEALFIAVISRVVMTINFISSLAIWRGSIVKCRELVKLAIKG